MQHYPGLIDLAWTNSHHLLPGCPTKSSAAPQSRQFRKAASPSASDALRKLSLRNAFCLLRVPKRTLSRPWKIPRSQKRLRLLSWREYSVHELVSSWLCSRKDFDRSFSETEHLSKKDAYDHYTTVFQDKDGNHIMTHHLYPPKK